MFKTDDEEESPNAGASVYDEPKSQIDGRVFRYRSPEEWLRSMTDRNRDMRGRVSDSF